MQLGQTLWSKEPDQTDDKQTIWNRRRARPILIGHIDGSTHRGEAKKASSQTQPDDGAAKFREGIA
jgi:hypothetical protein